MKKKSPMKIAFLGTSLLILFLLAPSASAQNAGPLSANPSSGCPGATVSVTGSGWMTILDECEYRLFFDINGDGSFGPGEQVAQQGPDLDLEENPDMSFTVPISAALGLHKIRNELRRSEDQAIIFFREVEFRITQAIRQDKTLWFLCEKDQPSFPVEVTLTAEGVSGNRFEWVVTLGADKVNFENGTDRITTTGNIVRLTSTAASTAMGDVNIMVTVGGAPCERKLEVRTPRRLSRRPDLDSDTGRGKKCNKTGTKGWRSLIGYEIVDQFNEIAKDAGINEQFGTETDVESNNWGSTVIPGGVPTPNGIFVDNVCETGKQLIPRPQPPQSPLSNRIIDRVVQRWFSGSTALGKGCHVQTNDLVRFIDHGRHENIQSPPR